MPVRCTCGAEPHTVDEHNLRAGRTARCPGCAKLATARSKKLYFGYADIVPDDEHRRRLLNRISAARNRCCNPRSRQWSTYGGRGITVCPGWLGGTPGRRAWLAYLVTLEGWDSPDLELDRIDNDTGYAPGNLRFVPREVNGRNRRTVRELQKELDALRAHLRHCTCRLA